MKNKRITESLLWAGASLCAVLAIVFSSMQGNMDSLRLADIVRPLVALGSLAVVLTLLLMAVCPPLGRVFPAAIYGFFSFYGIKELLPDFGYQHIVAYGMIVANPLALYRILRGINRLRAAIYVSAASGAIALTTCAVTVPALFYDPPPVIDAGFLRESLAAVTRHRSQAAAFPDIIYVVPDRYANAATLRREFGMDNSAFYAALRTRGFLVAENARSNYPKTFQSLASTLNSGYLGNFTTSYGTESGDKRPIYEALENNVVQDRLRKLGYQFHNYGNWWEPTRINRWATVNYQGYPPDSINNLSEFERTLMHKTPLLNGVRLFTDAEDKRECRRIKRKFRRLEEIGNGPQPVFVLAHMLVPHSPIVMDASGRCLDQAVIYARGQTTAWPDFKAAYIEYLKYFNAAVLRVIDQQIKRRGRSGRKLVFVIQADEGPFPKPMREALIDYDLSALTQRQISMKTGILNAILLPPEMAGDIAPPATPVNNWRIVFNALTGSKLQMLPHKVYIYPSEKNVYRFCDVTALLTAGKTPLRPCPD